MNWSCGGGASARIEDVWEIKLNDGYLMSSQFVDGEIALADLAFNGRWRGTGRRDRRSRPRDYTAQAALRASRVGKLTVIELIPQVEWRHQRLLPVGDVVAGDSRCILRQGDLFALATGPVSFDPSAPQKLHDAS